MAGSRWTAPTLGLFPTVLYHVQGGAPFSPIGPCKDPRDRSLLLQLRPKDPLCSDFMSEHPIAYTSGARSTSFITAPPQIQSQNGGGRKAGCPCYGSASRAWPASERRRSLLTKGGSPFSAARFLTWRAARPPHDLVAWREDHWDTSRRWRRRPTSSRWSKATGRHRVSRAVAILTRAGHTGR